jgi:hypothetical protein
MTKTTLLQKKIEKLEEMKKLLAMRNQKIRESKPAGMLANLLEGELERAELTLNAKDVVSKLQEIAEDLAKMQVEQIMPLVDSMKGEFSPDAASAFEQTVEGALDSALQAVRDAREQVNSAVLRMEGKLSDEDVSIPDSDMADTPSAPDTVTGPDVDTGLDLDSDADVNAEAPEGDLFGGEPATSGEEGNPLGRAKKTESRFVAPAQKKRLSEQGSSYPVTCNSAYKTALLEAIGELEQSDASALQFEIVADKYGLAEDELFEAYNARDRLDEFLPMLAGLAGRAVAGAAGRSIAAGAGNALARTAGKALSSQVGKAAVGAAARTAISKLVGNKDQAPEQPSPQERKNAEQTLASDGTTATLAKKLGMNPDDLAKALTQESRKKSPMYAKLKEHRIVEQATDIKEEDALKLVKERMRYVKTSKDLVARETFTPDIQLTSPKALVKQLSEKYGHPSGWQVATSPEGTYYVVSAAIPEAGRAKELEGQISSLEEEINSIRAKHGDVQEEYKLPQEIKVAGLRAKLGEYQTGYRHQVAKWLTMEEAVALTSLAKKYAPKKGK